MEFRQMHDGILPLPANQNTSLLLGGVHERETG
jgi:hypothetical protein